MHGFSAGSYTGLAVHEILSAFAVFPGLTKVAAIATPPEMMRLATGERTVTLVHCLDRLCVWKPDSLTEFNCQIARLPLAMGIVQPHIPVRRMASERKTQLTDALVRILSRFLTPAAISMDGAHDSHYREHLLPLAAHGDGHVLTVSIALLLAIMTGRSDLCIAGVFGAGKTRSLAVLLIALSCELNDFVAIVYTKENVAAKALADQVSDLAPPTIKNFGRLIGRMEEGKGEAYASKIDVRCSDRNRIILHKNILIATGGLRRKWRCATPLLAIGFLAPGLPLWTKVNSMATTMRLQLLLPYNSQC